MIFNKLILVGTLATEPQTRSTDHGSAVCFFSISAPAMSFRVTTWGQLAKTCQRQLRKGARAFVEGPLTIQTWQDNQGRERLTLKIQATDVRALDVETKERTATIRGIPRTMSTPAEVGVTGTVGNDVPF